jgi:hypothetical protein
MKPITEHTTLNDSLHDYMFCLDRVSSSPPVRLLLVVSQCTLPGQPLACAHVPGAGSTVPSDGVAGHVSQTPSFGPCLHFPDDPGDLADVVGCTVGAVLMVQMASEPLMLLLPSILLTASDVFPVSIGQFSTYLLDSPLRGWWNNRNQEEIKILHYLRSVHPAKHDEENKLCHTDVTTIFHKNIQSRVGVDTTNWSISSAYACLNNSFFKKIQILHYLRSVHPAMHDEENKLSLILM